MRKCSMLVPSFPGLVHVYFISTYLEQEFFLTVKDLVRKQPAGVKSYCKFSDKEKQLLSRSGTLWLLCVCVFHTNSDLQPH